MKNQKGGILIEAMYGIVLSVSVFLLLFSLLVSGWKQRMQEEKRFFENRKELRKRVPPSHSSNVDSSSFRGSGH